ncbi:tRNA 2-selenouridine(34) synthase MnmH [Marinimicrobium alkaliphilum]|uniref:tRNA 2-selenouridine(34) synthase MnmH n=1 Tax=Marinimicrobium alkaliphilum TaxID=2202654 RepID=UPI000DB9402D|nr:tRNA 2-selenouridine(34) synthase MnmH [Marinimicrobium alkaliphilum]
MALLYLQHDPKHAPFGSEPALAYEVTPVTRQARPDTDDYRRLLLQDVPLIDTRSPSDYLRGSLPNAVNLPLLSDAEHQQISECYRIQGEVAASQLEMRLIDPYERERRTQQWLNFARAHPQGYFYCARGGHHSRLCKDWLAATGAQYPAVKGGYKALRGYLLETIERVFSTYPLMVITGHTGAGKTELLNRLESGLDIEALANHRGTTFGNRRGGQPTPSDFENTLGIALLRHEQARPQQPLVIEEHIRRVGRCQLPLALRQAFEKAPLLLLRTSLEDRVEHCFQNYILVKLAEHQALDGEQEGFERFTQDLHRSLERIGEHLGGDRLRTLSGVLDYALRRHQAGDNSAHRLWIRRLLEDFYDPLYERALARKRQRIVFEGTADTLKHYVDSNLKN